LQPSHFYFIGVTTHRSSIRSIFPLWCDALGIHADLIGVDLPLDTSDERYREVLAQIREDEKAAGALVTSHKMGVIRAGRDSFSRLDPYAERLNEVACIVRRPDGTLKGSATDHRASILALKHIVPEDYWQKTGAHVACIGAGGSGQAFLMGLCSFLSQENRPETMILVARNAPRIEQAKAALEPIRGEANLVYRLAPDAASADAILSDLPPGSLVANATGMGKDVPGSPLTDAATFPENGIAWDFNYRGDLTFLKQAERQSQRGVRIEDGWVYFLYGWTHVMSEVLGFHLDDATFERLSSLAEPFRPGNLLHP
jgi:shikimate dehydrogenase